MAIAPFLAWSTNTAQAYVGADRRSAPPTTSDRDRRQLLAVLGTAAALWVGVQAALVTSDAARVAIDTRALVHFVDAVAIVFGAVVALLAFVRWRLTGETRPLWLGAAAVLLGPVAAGGGTLLPAVFGNAVGLPELRSAARLVGAGALCGAVRWAEIDTRLRPARLIGATALFTGLTALAWASLPWPSVRDAPWPQLALTLAWVGAALPARRAYRQSGDPSALAVAVTATVLGLGESVWGAQAVATSPDFAVAGATALQAAALGVLLIRGIRDLETAFCVQRQRLLETEIETEIERARERARQALDDERVHDARNSLLAIEGAATVLDRLRDRIAPEKAAAMLGALSTEVGHLRGLVSASDQESLEPFRLADMVALVVKAERRRSGVAMTIDRDVPDDLVVVGRCGETAEIVRHLLDNARRHAPGSPVSIRAERDGIWVSLYVEDRGRGIARHDRNAIFEHGRLGADDTTGGSGLGLFVARRLVHDQGGDIWVGSRPGGGASFGLCLRAAETDRSSPPVSARPDLEETRT